MMSSVSPEGHRSRIRSAYLANGIENMPEHNVVELFLSIIIPRKDVKPIAYELLNKFGSMQNVFSASAEDLMTVNGIGEQTAIMISLVSDINKKINLEKNADIKKLLSVSDACAYYKNMLGCNTKEQIVITTIDNSGAIINSHKVGTGSVNFSKVNKRDIVEMVLRDNASSVFIAHNHPNGDPRPSAADIDFTVNLLGISRTINIDLVDHIIVGENDIFSMRREPTFSLYFEEGKSQTGLEVYFKNNKSRK